MSNHSPRLDSIVITAAKIRLDTHMDVLWSDPDNPGKLCHQLVSTYRPEQLEPPLDNSLETLATLSRETAERDDRVEVDIHLSAQPLYESVGFWRKSQRIHDVAHVARLLLFLKTPANGGPPANKEEAVALAEEILDAWRDRL
jgi:hypothetical protein